MLMRYLGSLRASITAILVLISQIAHAQILLSASQLNEIAYSDQWLALLHLDNGQPIITDPKFLLSIDDFSPKNELLKTLELFSTQQSSHDNDQCRFVARAEYLQEGLNIALGFDDTKCIDYIEFRSRAPADKVSLIYASENLTQPSSMLGHSMLAISGKNYEGDWVDHAISFFTDLDTINIGSILWDTLYVGKPAHFVIEPLNKSLNYYSRNEQRNIWQYNLDLTDYKKNLLHKHLWELRNLNIDYLFHTHNCATFSFDIVSVAKPELMSARQRWVTPIDIVKAASELNMIDTVQVYPSNKWKVRMLNDFIEKDKIAMVEDFFTGKESFDFNDPLSVEMIRAISQYQLDTGKISNRQWLDIHDKWQAVGGQNYSLEINDYKSPLNTPDDSAYYIELTGQNMLFGWLPASHALEDDNRQYFGETELKLSELVLQADIENKEASLYKWIVYSAKSLTPRDRFTGGVSGSFSFGFDQFWHDAKDKELAAFISGSLGVTKKVTKDIGVFSLANIGQVGNSEKSYAYIAPEIGAYIYEIFDMKTIVSIKKEFRANLEVVDHLKLKQSLYLNSSAFIANLGLERKGSSDNLELSFQYKVYF